MKRPTMSDVAERAGVSKTTVSHVVNRSRFVAGQTKQRVLQAIAEIGYRPSAVARSLTTRRTKTVGVIVSDSGNQFFGEVVCGIENVLRPRDYALFICNTAETLDREAHYLDLLMRQRVDGIIAAATSQQWDQLTEAEVQQIPVVFVDRSFDGLDGPFVGVDNEGGAHQGVVELIRHGHHQIGILAGFQRLSTIRGRVAGFRRALRDHGIPLREDWVIPSPLTVESGREAMRELLSRAERPTGVFISNNLLSLGALGAIKDLGMKCPDDVSLVGFDDHPWAVASDPPLTVIRQPAREVGRRSAQLLLPLINGEHVSERRIILGCEVVTRESCRACIH